MVGYRNRDRLDYLCGTKVYRPELRCGEDPRVRKEALEAAVVGGCPPAN